MKTDKKAIYIPPVAEIQVFRTEDIITVSNDDTYEEDFANW